MSKHNSGTYYVKQAKKNGLEVTNGKGDHAKIFAPAGRGYMIVPLHRELSDGTEYVIRKWFRTLGIILTLIVGLIILWIR
jgi:predicted RNA binding protein YcfA (HicA-like mRNA interferase family)